MLIQENYVVSHVYNLVLKSFATITERDVDIIYRVIDTIDYIS